MIVITSPISTEITFNVSGSTAEHINKLRLELVRISMSSSFVLNASPEGDEFYAKISLLVSLEDVKKAKKIIDKHTQYFTNVKKFKNKAKTDKLKKD